MRRFGRALLKETKVHVIEPPIRPDSIEDTGIERNLLMMLIAKAMFTLGTVPPSRLADELMISPIIVTSLLEDMGNLALIESRGLTGSDMTGEIRYALTMKGNSWASDALEQSQYVGPAPVSMDAFRAQVEKQAITGENVDRAALLESLSELVLPEALANRLGPAVNSGKSILLYGDPGNGKTSIAEALGGAFGQVIHVPYCIEVGGQIINFFDENIHKRVELEPSDVADPRWVACKRPVVVTGGELTLEMLDLIFNPYAKFYEAPLHMKASGGIFILDDFGRQQVAPQTLLNRWIIPLERSFDYLTLHSGKKFSIPFDELVVFSTNIAPRSLADEATLRRLYFKIRVPTPTKEDYITIFENFCAKNDIVIEKEMLSEFYDEFYKDEHMFPSGHHPGYIMDHVIAACDYLQIDRAVSKELLAYGSSHIRVE